MHWHPEINAGLAQDRRMFTHVVGGHVNTADNVS